MSELLAVLSNPRRRRRKKGQRKASRRRRRAAARSSGFVQSIHSSSGRRVSRRRWKRSGYRRNPIGGRRNPLSVRGIGSDLIAAAAGAVGGVALDLVMRPMPLAIKGGPLNHLVRGAAAVGLGIVGQMFKVPYAGDIARGAMTVTLYNAARQYVLLPRGLGELTDEDVAALSEATLYDDGSNGVGEVFDAPAISNQMGEVLQMNGLGQTDDLELYE